jgi:DNA polymerase II small subunit
MDFLSTLENPNIAKTFIENIQFKYNQKIINKAFFINNPNKSLEIILNYNDKLQMLFYSFFNNLGLDLNLPNLKEPDIIGVCQDNNLNKKNETFLENKATILKIFENPPKKIEVGDFVKNFRNRYTFLKGLLQQRPELENLTSISRIEEKKQCSIIGMVYDKKVTKNENIILEVEDLTGKISVLVTKNKAEVYEKSKEVILDEVIGLKCSGSNEILFANDIIFPDCRIFDKKRAKKEEIAAFISDTHIGSNKFLENNFMKFINWLNGEVGNEKQRQEALKVKYLFITGDTVDGVGVYPSQEKELLIKDVNEQYKKLAEFLVKIRSDIKIIMCAGQHDAVRVAEPQPIIGEFYGTIMKLLNNVTLVTNPALIEIGSGLESSDKFKVLMYHGASMHGIINSIDVLRQNRAQDRPTSIVKYMLKKRHIAPSHSLTTYTPYEEDALLIKDVPDIFATGDLHRPEVSEYNGVLLIASSCWQSITPFEEKVGNNPDPCKVPIFNLKTREVKILDFSDAGSGDENKDIDENCEKKIILNGSGGEK